MPLNTEIKPNLYNTEGFFSKLISLYKYSVIYLIWHKVGDQFSIIIKY